MADTFIVFVMKHNDGSGFAELPVDTFGKYQKYSEPMVKFITEFAAANDMEVLECRDDFMSDADYRELLIAEGVIKPDIQADLF